MRKIMFVIFKIIEFFLAICIPFLLGKWLLLLNPLDLKEIVLNSIILYNLFCWIYGVMIILSIFGIYVFLRYAIPEVFHIWIDANADFIDNLFDFFNKDKEEIKRLIEENIELNARLRNKDIIIEELSRVIEEPKKKRRNK